MGPLQAHGPNFSPGPKQRLGEELTVKSVRGSPAGQPQMESVLSSIC